MSSLSLVFIQQRQYRQINNIIFNIKFPQLSKPEARNPNSKVTEWRGEKETKEKPDSVGPVLL